jgi:threonine dehydrogenase-like Zn-dependent dehydrogenase
MRATVLYGAGDVRVEKVPDARLIEPTDAVVAVTRACICGSDLWPYQSMEKSATGRRMGHEFIGTVEDVGSDVRTVKRGDLVVAPFAWSDGTCEFCRQGLQTSCLLDGGQGEAVRVPLAGSRLRPGDGARRRTGWIPGDERPRGHQGHGHVLNLDARRVVDEVAPPARAANSKET